MNKAPISLLHDITLFPKAIGLNEVKIKSHSNPHRAADLEMFKRAFLGTSVRARECTILNPQVLNVDYNDTTSTLTASSDDFVEIENDALPKHKDHIQNREVWYAAVVLLGGLLFVGFVLLLF